VYWEETGNMAKVRQAGFFHLLAFTKTHLKFCKFFSKLWTRTELVEWWGTRDLKISCYWIFTSLITGRAFKSDTRKEKPLLMSGQLNEELNPQMMYLPHSAFSAALKAHSKSLPVQGISRKFINSTT
jgi:hypothetical protein